MSNDSLSSEFLSNIAVSVTVRQNVDLNNVIEFELFSSTLK